MGLYLNPGNEAFRIAVSSEIYVDKSEMISFINQRLRQDKRYICVSRPRRFGKSTAANMLMAYYDRGCDSEKMFQKCKIAKDKTFAEQLNQHDVIYINVQQFLRKVNSLSALGKCIESAILDDLKDAYAVYLENKCYTLPDALAVIYSKETRTKKGFIFIVDEWDCLFRIAKDDTAAQKAYLDFLRDLFKDRTYVTLAYMTGILPIKKYGTQKVNSDKVGRETRLGGSAINIFDEYSMMNPKELAEYVGFTEQEVKDLCQRFKMNFEDVQSWYDGYQFTNHLSIYNPKSVVVAMLNREFDSYWTETETYEALKIYIEMDFDGLKTAIITMLGGGRCRVNSRKFQNDMTTFKTKDDVLTLLVHLGYLAYDKGSQEVYIPNQEIATEFMNAIDDPAWDGVIQATAQSKALVDATWNMDAKAVAEGMDVIHTETTSLLEYNDENSLACSVFMAYYSAKAYYMPPIRELPTGKGFADIVYLPRREMNRPALLIELKWDKTAESALQQIKDKTYVEALKNYTGDILLIGINYDKKDKKHQCRIERYKL